MAGYSNDEIEGAVTKFVKSTAKAQKDPLGPVDLSASFVDVIQLASSTLLFDPNAIFYLIFLATNKLNVEVQGALSLVADLVTAVGEVTKRTKTVTNQVLLGNASAALLEVDSILSTNSALSSPAFSRYASAIASFTTKDLAPNIKTNGEIVRPPPLARSESFTALSTLKVGYPEILTKLAQVRLMLSEFLASNLDVLTIQSSVRQARYDLQDLEAYFSGTSADEQKIAKCREAYLRLSAGKAVLTNLSTITDPTTARMADTATEKGYAAVAGPTGEALSAKCLGTISGPWSIEPAVNDQLSLRSEGELTPHLYTLTPPNYPQVQTSIYETFDIHPDDYSEVFNVLPENYTITTGHDWFIVHVTKSDGTLAEFSGQLPLGTHTGVAMAALIGTSLLENGVGAAINTVADISFTTQIHIKQKLPGDDRIIMIGQKLGTGWAVIDANTSLGFSAGNTGHIGSHANDGFQLDAGNVATLPHGSAITATALAAFVTSYNHGTYPAGTYVGSVVSRVIDGTPHNFLQIEKQIPGKASITVTAPTGTNRDRTLRAYTVLGLFEGQVDVSGPMSALEVAKEIESAGHLYAEPEVQRFESGITGEITGSTTFTIHEEIDTSIDHVNDQLLLVTGDSAGYHRITSVTPGIGVTYVVVSSDTPFTYNGVPIPSQAWVLYRELLKISSRVEDDLTSMIQVHSASANATLGLTATSHYGTTTGFQVRMADGAVKNFSQADVVKGDTLYLEPSGDQYTVSSVSVVGDQIEVQPPISSNLAASDFRIVSAAALAYSTFTAAMSAWDSTVLGVSDYSKNIDELMRAMNPILYNPRPTQAQRADALLALNGLSTVLIELSTRLVNFQVAPVPRIDAVLKMLKERSLDRAFDLLMSGYVKDFFGMDVDDASRSAYMLKTMRSIAQNDLSVSRYEEYGDDTVPGAGWESTDANFDFSDGDPDEGLALLGEVAVYPDYDIESPRRRF